MRFELEDPLYVFEEGVVACTLGDIPVVADGFQTVVLV